MPVSALIGLQWGDEGKGKIVDAISKSMDFVVRGQGGANAGHTVKVGDRQFVLHLVPSGALTPDVIPVVGNGVVADPLQLVAEINELEDAGMELRGRLKISDQAHLVLPTHRDLDLAQEKARGASKIGTTGRGIGPAYMDKVSRSGLRFADLRRGAKERLRSHLGAHREAVEHLGGTNALALDEQLEQVLEALDVLMPMVGDTVQLLHDAVARNASILLEGAQGALLDLDHGSYPFVTSSNCCTSGLLAGSGLSPRDLGSVIGVAKSYCTRVGSGPFPTEEHGEVGEQIRQKGHEFGATTRRPRRCGWFDAVSVRRAIRINGVSELVLTKTDVLAGQPTLKIATAYKSGAEDADSGRDVSVEPAYVELAGFDDELGEMRSLEEFPQAALDLIDRIEAECAVPVTQVSTGPERAQIVQRDPR